MTNQAQTAQLAVPETETSARELAIPRTETAQAELPAPVQGVATNTQNRALQAIQGGAETTLAPTPNLRVMQRENVENPNEGTEDKAARARQETVAAVQQAVPEVIPPTPITSAMETSDASMPKKGIFSRMWASIKRFFSQGKDAAKAIVTGPKKAE